MKWSDTAIILSSRKLGENSAIIGLMTPKHGFYKGVDRWAFSKSKRGLYQRGNIVSANWQARLHEHLGNISCELMRPVAAIIMDDPTKLAVMNSAVGMVENILAEREKQPVIYACLEALIDSLCNEGDYLAEYVKLEFNLLVCSGFGIDLERCAATGRKDDLVYVSPRSGRAVNREAGKPYHDKLLRLPAFLHSAPEEDHKVSAGEIREGMRLCGYFIHERIFTQRNIPSPSARARLINMLVEETT